MTDTGQVTRYTVPSVTIHRRKTNGVVTRNADGTVSWEHRQGDYYLVTGITADRQRFRRVCLRWEYAEGVNVFRGTKWLVRNGNKHRLYDVIN
jgi:hypothetical protein